MAKFRKKPLGVLDRIYGFLSGKTQLSDMALESPITPVHDLSRSAEFGSGYGKASGFTSVSVSNSHVMGGSLYTFVKPHAYLQSLAPSNRDVDLEIWLLGINVYLSTVNFTSCKVAFHHNEGVGGTDGYIQLLRSSGYGVYSSGAAGVNLAVSQADDIVPPYQLPLYLPYNSDLTLVSVSVGALTATLQAYVWAGPPGCRPPVG